MGSNDINRYILHDDLEQIVKNEPIYEVYSQEAEEAYYDSNSNDSNSENPSNKNQIHLFKNENKTYDDYEEDSEEDDDIKMINATQILMNQIDENLSKISYIDLTQDDDTDDDNDDSSTNQIHHPKDYVSPIVICQKSASDIQPISKNIVVDSPILVKPKQSDLSSKNIPTEIPICISLVDDENSTESMNNAMIKLCSQKEQEYNQKIENKKIDETINKMEVENKKDDEDDYIDISQLKEIESKIYENRNRVIKNVKEPVKTLTSNHEKNDKEEENRGKKVLINLKRIRDMVSSSEEEQETLKKKSSIETPTKSKRQAKRLLSSSDEADECKSENKNSPIDKSDYLKQFSNKNSKLPSHSTVHYSPSMLESKNPRMTSLTNNHNLTPQKSIEKTESIDKTNSKNLSKITTGEILGIKRTMLLEAPPETMKIRKQSLKSPNGISKSNSIEAKKSFQFQPNPQSSNIASSSSSTKSPVIVDISIEPDLNSMDMAKKEAIEKLNKNNFTLMPINKKSLPKAYEQMKSLKCKESSALKKYIDTNNKKSHASGPIGLTQTMNLAKIENQRRLESIMNDKSNQSREDPKKPSTIKNMPKTIPIVEPSEPIEHSKPKQMLIKPVFINKNIKENEKIIPNNSNNNTNNVIKQPQENKSSSEIGKINDKNDVVGKIMNSMNKQIVNQTTNQNQKSTKDFVYTFENFIYRIVKCNYDWLKEQEKNSEPPPVVTPDEKKILGPIVENYLSYNDYFTTMFPLLLSETWQEITRPWKEMYIKKERKTYQSMPLWLKQKDRTSDHPDLMVFTCQTLIDSNVKQSPIPLEDDLLHFIIWVNDGKSKYLYNLFGVVFKCCRLKRDDERILDVVKEYLREQDQKTKTSGESYSSSQSEVKHDKIASKNFIIYELQIYVKSRKYQIQQADKLEYDLITSLSSTFRRSRALISFQNSPLKEYILNGSSCDPIFWPDKKNIKKCGEVDFKFDKLKDYNESQQIVIMEASSLILSTKPKFYFIQGPPGTGKSHTIVGILNAIFARHKLYNSYAETAKQATLQNLKILVCSPSNGGCDELTRRLKTFKKTRPDTYKELNIVRVGRIESIHRDCDDITLDNLARKKFETLVTKKNCEKSNSLNEHYKQLKCREETMRKKLKALKSGSSNNECTIKELESQLEEVVKRKKDFETKLKKSSNFNDMSGSDRKKLEIESKELVLKEADIIICTLNFSGNQILDCLTAERNKGRPLVSLVIIDEAAQCLELESLIPLRFGCNKFIQVGDPEQLPATVLSKLAQDCGLAQSLFERVYQKFRFEDNNPIRMLFVQYRMNSEICLFPSNNFYRGKLKTNEEANKQRSKLQIEPYLVFNIEESQEIGESKDEINGSIYNPIEAETILEFCKVLIERRNLKLKSESIGIITPYQRQVQHLRDLFSKNNLEKIEIGTVDGYQGREKDVILFSTVRAKGGSIGFLTNRQRLNVSLTRAKYALYIFCHAKSLMVNQDWRNCIEDAERRQLFINHFSIIDK